MNQIPKNDFINLLSLTNQNFTNEEMSDITTAIETFQSIEDGDYSAEDKTSEVKTRLQQNEFAKKVKELYKYKCAICEISNKEFLIASHIIPWSKRKDCRLDPQNGICLCVFHDRAFDRGYFYIDNQSIIRIADRVKSDHQLYKLMQNINNRKIKFPRVFSPKLEYLEYHKNHIFKN